MLLVLPPNCHSIYGPHTIECLLTLWSDVGCLEAGNKSPYNLSETELENLDALTIE